MERISAEEGRLLVELEMLRLSPRYQEAFEWSREQGDLESGGKTRSAPASEDEERVARSNARWLGDFFETAGVLVRHGALSEQLFFDRYAVEQHWRAARPFVEADRKDSGVANLGENFEYLAKSEKEVQEGLAAERRHEPSARTRAAR